MTQVSQPGPSDGRPGPSVAILVDDLARWLVAGLHPTGIQRVVSELLDTALQRPDIRSWAAVSSAPITSDDDLGLLEVTRDSLRWEVHLRRPHRTLGNLRHVRNLVRRVPLPHPIFLFAKRTYGRLALALGEIQVATPDQTGRPDLVLVPGAFWSGESPERIARIAAHGIKVRMIVYDLFPVRNPEWYKPDLCREFETGIELVAPIADRIVTLSAEVAEQVAERYPGSRDRIRVGVPTLAAHAPRSEFNPGLDETELRVPGPFLFALSTVEPRKNHRVILDAWRLARRDPRLADAWLVIAGRHGWKADDIEAEIARDAGALQILRLGRVSDAEVAALYRDCIATVHASWAEGFGLPARESVVRGVPTIMSSAIPTDGLPEGTYRTFDPSDTLGLAELMVEALVCGRVRTPVELGSGTGWEPVLSALID